MKVDERGEPDISVVVRALWLNLLSVLVVIAAYLGLLGWLHDHLPGI